MQSQKRLGRDEMAVLVKDSLNDVLLQRDEPPVDPVGESTRLIGRGSVLDSLGLVTLIVDLEQRLEEEYSIPLILADDRAVSQKNSPFLTVRSLTDYLCTLIEAQQRNDGP